MDIELKTNLLKISNEYLLGWETLRGFSKWLAGINWDEGNISNEDKEALGKFEVLTTEIIENLRPEEDFSREVLEFVVRNTSFTDTRITVTNTTIVSLSPTLESPGITIPVA